MKTRTRPQIEPLEGRTLLTAGTLDTSFGGTGIVTTQVGTGGDGGLAVAVFPQSDPNGNAGKIVVVGSANSSSGSQGGFALVRYNTDGSLDTSFGTSGNGQVMTLLSPTAQANTVAIQSDGKIVVGGDTYVSNREEFALARYNPNGTLDTSFGNGGVVITHFAVPTSKKTTNSSSGAIESLVIQPDGQILVAGVAWFTINGSSSEDVPLARYNTNGTLDTSFGNGGTVFTRTGTTYEAARSVGLQTINGVTKIVVVGDSTSSGQNPDDTVVIRYNLNGSIDTSFGVNGIASLTSFPMIAVAGAIQPDGKILAAGWWDPNQNTIGFGLARFNADGSLDTTFNGDGAVGTIPGPLYEGEAWSVVVQPDGAIILGGQMAVPTPNTSPQTYTVDFGLARYTPTGQLDPSFGPSGTGIVLTPVGSPSHAVGHALALQADGAIVAAGNGAGGPMIVARYLGDPVPAASMSGLSSRSAATITPAPTLIPLVLDDPSFLDTLTKEKRHLV
jgi:uncharacterized delta-60 repeat protein